MRRTAGGRQDRQDEDGYLPLLEAAGSSDLSLNRGGSYKELFYKSAAALLFDAGSQIR